MSPTAFRPTLVLETSDADERKSCIQCLEVCGDNLYTAGEDCVIRRFVLLDPGGQGQAVQELRKTQLGSKGIITQMKAFPFLDLLLVLCDNSICIYTMSSLEPLPSMQKIHGVSSFAVNDSNVLVQKVSTELFAVSSKRRVVTIHMLSADRWECLREVSLSQDPLAIAVDGDCLCVATYKKYILYDLKSGKTLDLFPHEPTKQARIVKAVGNGEFLLSSPGSLGMFVTKYGISQHPPVPWPEGTLAAVVHLPYVLALQSEALHIYSMLDQRCKQTIFMHGARGLLFTPDGAFVFTEREVYNLSAVPPEVQVKALVREERVDEALELLQGVKAQLPKDTYKLLEKHVTCTAGFIKFYQGSFLEAKDLFIKGAIDPEKIISLYPGFSPPAEELEPQLSTMFGYRDLRELSGVDPPAFKGFQEFLVRFLTAVRGTSQSHGCRQEVDCALLRLHAERGSHVELTELLSSRNNCLLSTCVPCLEQHGRFFALGLLYQSQGQDDKAVQTWINIVDGHHTDSSKPNVFEHIVAFLAQKKCRKFVWKYADWVLRRNQEVGIQIFTGRADIQETDFEGHVSFFRKYPKALILYLEHLVNDLNSKEEKHHTLLATAYIDHVLRVLEQQDSHYEAAMDTTRGKLQQLLQESPFYNAVQVKEAVMGSGLYTEEVILHRRSGEHDEALQVLVHKATDHQAAEDYCRAASLSQNKADSQRLFLTLLKAYLASPQLVSLAVDLLNHNAAAFDLVDALQTLPSSWSLQLVDRFLSDSVRWIIHNRRTRWLEKNLFEVEHLRLKATWIRTTQGMIKVEKDRICQRCGRYLGDPTFLRSSKGELLHIHCMRNQ